MIAVPGHNCWRREHADRAAFLVDGQAYFDAFAAAAERAEHSIIVLAWDFHGAVCLRADDNGGLTTRLDEFLDSLVQQRPSLNVHILDWDYPLLYASERQFLPAYRFQWWTHRRFHFHLDKRHAFGGSHHQKVVVIDDAIAFAGGVDFASGRFDTPDHTCDDCRRVSPSGDPCGPYHDLMMAVDGDAAAALGELARERWYCATGERLQPPPRTSPTRSATDARADLWPEQVRVDARDVQVAIARTAPATGEQPAVREIEQLYCDTIAAAKKWIYIENQYFTAEHIGQALLRRLQEPDGPEIVIVTTQVCAGWLEESTMGVLRARLVDRLIKADRFHRLRLFTPVVPGLTDTRYTVHAKAMVVDDTFARVGSANLNNRSMGLDTECDLAIEADGDAATAAGVAEFRNRLLGEHLCVPHTQVATVLAETGSIVQTIERLRHGAHTLQPLDHTVPQWLDDLMPAASIVDPDNPVDSLVILEEIVPVAPDVAKRSWRWGALVLAIVVFVGMWTVVAPQAWTPDQVATELAELGRGPLAGIAAIGLFVIGALLFVPVTILIVALAMAFGPWNGLLYAALGSTLSALAGLSIGRFIGHGRLRRLAGATFGPVRSHLARHGILAVAAVRAVPLAPFTVVNMIAGIAGVGARDMVLGTLIGMAPGLCALTIFGHRLAHATRDPTLDNLLIALLLAACLTALAVLTGKRLARARLYRPRHQQKRARRARLPTGLPHARMSKHA